MSDEVKTVCAECQWHRYEPYGLGICYTCHCPSLSEKDVVSGKPNHSLCSAINTGSCQYFLKRKKSIWTKFWEWITERA